MTTSTRIIVAIAAIAAIVCFVLVALDPAAFYAPTTL